MPEINTTASYLVVLFVSFEVRDWTGQIILQRKQGDYVAATYITLSRTLLSYKYKTPPVKLLFHVFILKACQCLAISFTDFGKI